MDEERLQRIKQYDHFGESEWPKKWPSGSGLAPFGLHRVVVMWKDDADWLIFQVTNLRKRLDEAEKRNMDERRLEEIDSQVPRICFEEDGTISRAGVVMLKPKDYDDIVSALKQAWSDRGALQSELELTKRRSDGTCSTCAFFTSNTWGRLGCCDHDPDNWCWKSPSAGGRCLAWKDNLHFKNDALESFKNDALESGDATE